MSKAEMAVATFNEGFMCSQAIVSSYCEAYGLPRETALRLAETFGGGMNMGHTCGAVTGALMVIGLKYGREEAGDEASRQQARDAALKFVREFEARHGTLACKALLGTDISTAEGLQAARENGLFTTLCPGYVRDAAEIVEGIL